jgi:predicted alternative tryptophan synthase beta-subunit
MSDDHAFPADHPRRDRRCSRPHRRRRAPHAADAPPGRQLGLDGAELWLKLEHLQVGGSFKARGMFNRMRSNAVPEAGVVIASGGNAGIAVAVAAQALGVRCEVFVPESSSAAKRPSSPSSAPCSPSPAPATPMRSPPASRARQRPARC